MADFNGDGIADIAATSSNNTVTILLGNGDGTFTQVASSPATGVGPTDIVAGDFNGDGKMDLAVSSFGLPVNGIYPPGVVTVLLGNGDGTFTAAPNSPTTGSQAQSLFVAGDFNGDGISDSGGRERPVAIQ